MSEVLRELIVELSLNSDNFSRNIRTITNQIKEAESAFKLAGAGIHNFEKTAEGRQAKLTMLNAKLKEQERLVKQYEGALGKAKEKMAESTKEYAKYSGKLAAVSAKHEETNRKVENAENVYMRLAATMGENDAATIRAKETLETYRAELEGVGEEVKLREGQVEALSKTMQNNADTVSKATANLNNAKAAVRETGAELATFTSAWTRAGESMQSFSKSAKAAGKVLTDMGKTMSAAVTAPITALGTAAIKASIDYEYAFADVRKTVEATEEEFGRLSDSIKQMSTEVAMGAGGIAEVVSIAGQMGVANEHLMTFSRTMIDLGNSTDIVASDAAMKLSQFTNIMQMSQGEMSNLGSALVELGNNYATTESKIMDMSLRLAGAGKQVGLSEAQILGIAAALSSVGIEAQMGGSAFSKALVKMELASVKGGKTLEDFAKVSGMTAKQFKALWDADPAGAFQAFIEGLSKMDEEGQSAIATLEEIGLKEIRLRDTLLRSTNAVELFGSAIKDSSRAWKANTALAEEANKRYKTVRSQLTNLKNTVSLASITFGDDLAPTIQKVIDKANELLASFLGMDQSQRLMIMKNAAIVASIGPALLVLGKLNSVVGNVTGAIGKFATSVGEAGGGLAGFTKTVLSNKLAMAALAAALVYGVYKLIDYASGAKRARDAVADLKKTTEEWRDTAAKTFYGAGEGLPFFGMTKEGFTTAARSSKKWLEGVLAVWSDGKKETNEIVNEWTESFKAATDAARKQLNQFYETAWESGNTSLTAQLEKDMAELDRIDKELAALLKKRQSKNFTDADKIKLQELIDAREAIEIKYRLTPADTADGFDTIRQKLEAEVARAKARGFEDADIKVYENAVLAAAQGMAALNAELDARYDKEYALIQLMDDDDAKRQALEDLNKKYNADRVAAAEEYAKLLREIVMPVWEKEGVRDAEKGIQRLRSLLDKFSVTPKGGREETLVIEDINKALKDMDKAALIEYLGVLSQIQSLLGGGMSLEDVQAAFPEIDVSGALDQFAGIQDFLKEYKNTLPDLAALFGEIIPEEMQKIAFDLDMQGVKEGWAEFSENPGAITAKAIITEAVPDEGVRLAIAAAVNALFEHPDGVDTTQLTPTGLLAYVTAYAESTNGADVSALTPDMLTAIVKAYKEIETGADMSLLTPEQITAKVFKYLEREGVDTSKLTPEAATAAVLAYEEITGGASTKLLNPTNLAATVVRYLQAEGVNISKLKPSDIEGEVTKYAEAANVDKSELMAAIEIEITKYNHADNVRPPNYIEATVGVTGYDLSAVRKFFETNPVDAYAVLRLSDKFATVEDALKDGNVTFWQDGVRVDATMVVKEKLTPDTVALLNEEDGTMHIFITPKVTGEEEVIEDLREKLSAPPVEMNPFTGEPYKEPRGVITQPPPVLDNIKLLTKNLAELNREKSGWDAFWGPNKGDIGWLLENELPLDAIGDLSAYVAEVVTAIKEGKQVSDEDLDNLENILNFVSELQIAGLGEDIIAGIGAGMTAADWTPYANDTVANLDAALRTASESHSPALKFKPVGDDVAAGVGAGITEHDFTSDAAAMAATLKAAASASLNTSTLIPIGINAMAGISAGIRAGKSGVVNEMRLALKAAVDAAKAELKIASPSAVFRDEIGRVSIKSVGIGALQEAKAQGKVIRNAMRYLTGEARIGANAGVSSDNRRTYNQNASVSVNVDSLSVNDRQDIHSLALEISHLVKRQLMGAGVRV